MSTIILIDQDTTRLEQIEKLLSDTQIKLYKFTRVSQAISFLETQKIEVIKILIHISALSSNIEQYIAMLKYTLPKVTIELYVADNQEKLQIPKTIKIKVWFFLKEWTLFLQSLEKKDLELPIYQEQQEIDKSLIPLDDLTKLLRPYLIFRSPIMRRSLELLPRISQSKYPVFIGGETGTGKEMVARAIHAIGLHSNGPFIALNCGAIPENLIESELFGHEKGAFTGAIASRKGKLALAEGGSLFLDEIGEMPLALQARLLRVLEEKEFYPIGSEKLVSFNARIIAATQVSLEQAIQNGLFREDLYYRLNILRIQIPSLRERVEDIALLAWHFLERTFKDMQRAKPYPSLSDKLLALLEQGVWKGNVRELRNVITRLAVLLPLQTKIITLEHMQNYFPEYFSMPLQNKSKIKEETEYQEEEKESVMPISQERELSLSSSISKEENDEGVFIPIGTTVAQAEETLLLATLKATQGNKAKTSRILGISERTLRRKLE